MRPYTPIDCSFYDRLEEAATLRRVIPIEYIRDGQRRTISARINDLRLMDGAEWMILETGVSIRLDDLLRVDGYDLPGTCGVSDPD